MSIKKLKIAVIGGGSTYTPELIECFIKKHREVPADEIYLMDIDKTKLEIVGNLVKRMVEAASVPINIILTNTLREALENSNFVIFQIRVEGLKARIRDEILPLKFNCIGQETTGAGGFACALRTIPVIIDICKEAEKYCPHAWIINFTNPSGIITEAISKYSNMKVLGLCNIPVFIKRKIAETLNINTINIDFDYTGLNHLSWINNIKIRKEDKEETIEIDKINIKLANLPEFPIAREITKNLSYLPSPYLKYYYHHDKILEEQKKSQTRAEKVLEIERDLLKLYSSGSLKEKPKELEQRGGACYSEAAFSIISSILNNKGEKHIVNVKNDSTLSGIDKDGVIEKPVLLYSTGYETVEKEKSLPLSIKGLIQSVKSYESLTVETAINKSQQLAILSLMAHPLIGQYEKASLLWENIMKENKFNYKK